jgi:voltage-gated potassium channel
LKPRARAVPFAAWRRQAFALLGDGQSDPETGHTVISGIILIAIAACAAAVMTVTMPGMPENVIWWCDRIREATDLFFTVEYVLRIWVAPEYLYGTRVRGGMARRRYLTSFLGVVDLLVILPFWVNQLNMLPRDWYLVLEMLTLFKLARYAPGLALVAAVLRSQARALVASFLTLGVLVTLSSSVMYVLEHQAQPQLFTSIPHSLWWGVITMTTVGYGDIVPVTAVGKMFGGFVVLLGIAMFAIPAGLMATGFAEEIRRREFMVTWRAVASLPLFDHLDASRIAEIASLLKPQAVPAGTVIVRKGDRADSMFFIMAGQVEVEILPHPVILEAGQHFGEIALIRRTQRTATVLAVTECRLLALGVADFQRLLDVHPDIRERIASTAKERHAQRKAAEDEPPLAD